MSEQISGKFLAKASTYNFGTAKTGTVGCAVMFEVTSGPHAGARVPWSGWFGDKSAERTIESLGHMGWKGEDPTTIDVSELPNEVEIVVEVESFTSEQTGQTHEASKVQWVNRPGSVQLAAMGAAEAVSFKEKMKGLVLAQRAKKPQTKEEAGSFEFGANGNAPAKAGRAF